MMAPEELLAEDDHDDAEQRGRDEDPEETTAPATPRRSAWRSAPVQSATGTRPVFDDLMPRARPAGKPAPAEADSDDLQGGLGENSHNFDSLATARRGRRPRGSWDQPACHSALTLSARIAVLLEVLGTSARPRRPERGRPARRRSRRPACSHQHAPPTGRGRQGDDPGHGHPAGDTPANRGALLAEPGAQDRAGRDMVVDSAMPRWLEDRMIAATTPRRPCPAVRRSPPGPCRGCGSPASRRRRCPAAMATAQAALTQNGMDCVSVQLAVGDQGQGDHAHRLLGVVGAVCQRDQGGRADLAPAEAAGPGAPRERWWRRRSAGCRRRRPGRRPPGRPPRG